MVSVVLGINHSRAVSEQEHRFRLSSRLREEYIRWMPVCFESVDHHQATHSGLSHSLSGLLSSIISGTKIHTYIMQFSNIFLLAASLSLSLAAPAPTSTTEVPASSSEPISVSTEGKIATNNLAANGDWNSICKNSLYGEQVCFIVVRRHFHVRARY